MHGLRFRFGFILFHGSNTKHFEESMPGIFYHMLSPLLTLLSFQLPFFRAPVFRVAYLIHLKLLLR